MGVDHLGKDMRKVKEGEEKEKEIKSLDEADIALLKTYVSRDFATFCIKPVNIIALFTSTGKWTICQIDQEGRGGYTVHTQACQRIDWY